VTQYAFIAVTMENPTEQLDSPAQGAVKIPDVSDIEKAITNDCGSAIRLLQGIMNN